MCSTYLYTYIHSFYTSYIDYAGSTSITLSFECRYVYFKCTYINILMLNAERYIIKYSIIFWGNLSRVMNPMRRLMFNILIFEQTYSHTNTLRYKSLIKLSKTEFIYYSISNVCICRYVCVCVCAKAKANITNRHHV